MLKENWTLDEVNALPEGEHDFFDRKSGRLISSDSCRKKIAQAFSAFANSGGGHLIIGVADDGTIDGVPPFKGKTCAREWIEQLIPNLVEPTPTKFRVHRLESTDNYSIPDDKVVIVIDIADSYFAPFQSRVSKIYYHRVGGHSVPAAHFYLDALRNRTVAPSFNISMGGCRVIRSIHEGTQLFTQLIIDFTIKNTGNVTPSHWYIDLFYNGTRVSGEGSFRRTNFPPFTIRLLSNNEAETAPILLGMSYTTSIIIGLYAEIQEGNLDDLTGSIRDLLNPANNMLEAAVMTEANTAPLCTIDLQGPYQTVTPEAIKYFIHDEDRTKGSLGGGVESVFFKIEREDDPTSLVKVRGVVKNTSKESLRDAIIVMYFLDKNGQTLHKESCKIGIIPPGVQQPWNDLVRNAAIWEAGSVRLLCFDQDWFCQHNSH